MPAGYMFKVYYCMRKHKIECKLYLGSQLQYFYTIANRRYIVNQHTLVYPSLNFFWCITISFLGSGIFYFKNSLGHEAALKANRLKP